VGESELAEREQRWQTYRTEAQEVNGYLVVEGDRVFPDENALREHFEREYARVFPPEQNEDGLVEKLAVFRWPGGIEETYVPNDAVDIDYCVDDAFANHDDVVDDMAEATREWELVANVNFKYVAAEDDSCDDDNDNVDFAVVPAPSGLGYVACAANKNALSGCPITSGGPELIGILAIRYASVVSPRTGAGVLMHELGHILGFSHEHPWRPAGPCDAEPTTYTRHLTEYDHESVMHYRPLCGSDNRDFALSELDGVGSREIYGPPASWIVASSAAIM